MRRPRRRRSAAIAGAFSLIVAAAGVALVIAFAGGFDRTTTQQVSGEGSTVVPVALVDAPLGFDVVPDVITVDRGAHVVLDVTNEANEPHDLAIGGSALATRLLAPGESQRVNLGALDHPARGWCRLPDHRLFGMELDIRVADLP